MRLNGHPNCQTPSLLKISISYLIKISAVRERQENNQLQISYRTSQARRLHNIKKGRLWDRYYPVLIVPKSGDFETVF